VRAAEAGPRRTPEAASRCRSAGSISNVPRPPKIHWYDNPLPWLGLQILEVGLISGLVRVLIPPTWPDGVRWGTWAVLLVGALVANYVFLRRLRARDETP